MTATTYQVHPGFDASVGALTDLSPQPASPKLNLGDFHVAADWSAYYDSALFMDLVYEGLPHEDYPSLLSQLGLASADSAQNTFRVPSEDRSTTNVRNGTVMKPNPDWTYGYATVKFRIMFEDE